MDPIFFLSIMTLLAVFGLAAVTWGVDSTEESADPRRPFYPVGID
jgi:hypothetical protein